MGDQELLLVLPRTLQDRMRKICKRTGLRPIQLMLKMLALYEAEEKGLAIFKKIDVEALTEEEREAIIFAASSIRGKMAAETMTAEQKKARARKGGIAKAANAKKRAAQQFKPQSDGT